MLDPRIYRAGLIPALLALIIAAFSVQTPPRGLRAALAPDSFAPKRAFASLNELARSFPDRRPGSRGDVALSQRVREVLENTGFDVATRTFEARTVTGRRELATVQGIRAGRSSRRIVVLAHRDALRSPARADLSGTAALLELARVFRGRQLRKTLVLVSTSGGTGGNAGAAEAAGHLGPNVDAVIVLGDLAGRSLRRPLVVPWSNAADAAPFVVRRTVADAVALETGLLPGDPGLVPQLARLAVPLTLSEQGELLARGHPAVLISAGGERGAEGSDRIDRDRFGTLGRAALRSVTAFDQPIRASRAPQAEIFAARKVLPGWAVRLVVAALILPVALAAIDGVARVRRRKHPVAMWVAWVLSAAAPFAFAAAFAWVLSLTGLAPTAPPTVAPGGALPLDGAAVAVVGAVLLAGVLGWFALRPLLLAIFGVRGDPGSPGAAAALLLVLVVLVIAVWAVNPFAAALLLPALHAWLLLTTPEIHVRRRAAFAVVFLTVVPVLLLIGYYAVAFSLAPGELVWTTILLVVGGHLGVLGTLAWCVALGGLAAVLMIIRAQGLRGLDRVEPVTRGPASYAGPGSLGGTESALRR